MSSSPSWLDQTAWPFVPREFVHADGSLHYIDEGDGPLLVLVHGTPTWSFEYRHVIGALRQQHRILALDHLGFGLSSRPRTAGYSPEHHARRFAAWFAHVVGDAPYDIVVHDFGGPIALPTVLDTSGTCRRLVITNSWGWDLGRDPALRRQIDLVQGRLGRWLYRYLNASQRLLMPNAYGDRSRLTSAIHRQYLAPFADADSRERVLFALARSLKASADFFDQIHHRAEELRALDVHLVWGMKDGTLPPSVLHQWTQLLPTASVHRFEAAGHWPHEEEPERYIAVLRQILG